MTPEQLLQHHDQARLWDQAPGVVGGPDTAAAYQKALAVRQLSLEPQAPQATPGPSSADAWLEGLLVEVPWRQEQITLFGRTHPLPRLTCWVADPGCRYSYSGLMNEPEPWSPPLDALRQRLGGIEGRRVVVVGDILHSRVARSNVALLDTLGAEVVLVAPPTLLPLGVAGWGHARVSHSLDAELPAADAVLMLRVQAERMNGGFFPSEREYSSLYGLSDRRRAVLPDHAVVLHPGPMLRGMEIAFAVADSPQSAVLQQVSNGVHVRMAVLFHLLVGTDAAVSV
jgi:aspartate carbamoyltransferase catalytic subunit